MRLWHSKLIPLLDGRRLCDLHMSCCNLRGKGWGKRNVAINYLYDDELGEYALAVYHEKVLEEMSRRGYKYDMHWEDYTYCGKNRPSKPADPQKYEEAYLRNVPLKGHTLRLYGNDVKALQERGLPIEVVAHSETNATGSRYSVYEARNGEIKTTYRILVSSGTQR